MDVEARLRWRRGHELEIFSVSQNRWFKGVIDNIDVEDGIEWFTITYDSGNYEKIVDRMDFELLRPIKRPIKPQAIGMDFFEYENNINEIVKILDRNQDGVIDLKELQAFYPDTAKALFMELDIDGSCDLSVWELKTKINTNEKAIMVLNKLKHVKKYQHSLGPLNVAPPKQLPNRNVSMGLTTRSNSSPTSTAALPSFIKQRYRNRPQPAMDIPITPTSAYNYMLHPGTTFTPSVACPVPINLPSVSQYPVPEYQEYLVKKLEKENEQLKEALRAERTEKKMKIAEVEELKKFIKTLKNKMITATHKKDLQIDYVKHIILEKNQSLENLQSELHLKIKEQYIEVQSLRNTISYQHAHIRKLEEMKNKLKINLIKHFNNEFTKRDEEIKRLQNELDKNEMHLSQISCPNKNDREYISQEIDQMKLKIDQEIAQKNRIIISLQNSLSKMKKEIEVSEDERNVSTNTIKMFPPKL
jgi:hypothetical protein